MKKYEVLTFTICDGWVNTWHEYDDDNNEIPMVFDSLKDAEVELSGYLYDYRRAYERGDIECDENPDDYMIVEVQYA